MSSKVVLIFNPEYDDIPDVLKYSDGCVKGCTKCSETGKYCPTVIRNFLEELIDEVLAEVILISEEFWKQNYGERSIEIIGVIAKNNDLELWKTTDFSDEFGLASFGSDKSSYSLRKVYKNLNNEGWNWHKKL